MSHPNPFKWRHFKAEIILLCGRWYLRYALSYRDLEEMMRERGLQVDHTTIYRWVQRYAPEPDKRSRPHLKACNDSWKVDETYIKVRKAWMYLYRAVDSDGNTLEFLLSPTRDAEAAKRFFVKALRATACSAPRARPVAEQVEEPTALADPITTPSAPRVITVETNAASLVEEPTAVDPNPTQSAPRVINVDKNAAYPKALAELKAAGILPESVELRQVKYLKNLIEQDHRFIKCRVKPGMGFFSVETAGRTLQGYEAMHMIRKGTDARGEQRRCYWAGGLHRHPVWSGGLS
jgi:transposase, IS6 family